MILASLERGEKVFSSEAKVVKIGALRGRGMILFVTHMIVYRVRCLLRLSILPYGMLYSFLVTLMGVHNAPPSHTVYLVQLVRCC